MKRIDVMNEALMAMQGMPLLHTRKKQVEDLLREVIAAEEAQAVEPVAWLYRGVDEVMQLTFTDQTEVDAFRVNDQGWEPATPLFTHPTPATEPAKPSGERADLIVSLRRNKTPLANMAADMLASDAPRVPMTPDELDDAAANTGETMTNWTTFARAVEAHHGIGVKS